MRWGGKGAYFVCFVEDDELAGVSVGFEIQPHADLEQHACRARIHERARQIDDCDFASGEGSAGC